MSSSPACPTWPMPATQRARACRSECLEQARHSGFRVPASPTWPRPATQRTRVSDFCVSEGLYHKRACLLGLAKAGVPRG